MGLKIKCEYCNNEASMDTVEYSDRLNQISKFEFIVNDEGSMVILTCTKCNEEVDIHMI